MILTSVGSNLGGIYDDNKNGCINIQGMDGWIDGWIKVKFMLLYFTYYWSVKREGATLLHFLDP